MNRLIAGIALATGWAAAQWNRDLHTTEVARFRPLGACPSNGWGRVTRAVATDARRRDAGHAKASSRSGNTADGVTPPVTLWEGGGCGHIRCLSSSPMTRPRFPPRSLSVPPKPRLRDPNHYSDRLLACISHPSTRTDANGATQARKPKVDIPADHGMEY